MDAIMESAATYGHKYQWLVVVGAFGAFAFGFATGANDVANAFGTSVGSRALKLWQAVIIAAVFEFAGALALGRVVTNTIAGGIADVTAFSRTPEVYAYGMVCALFVGSAWQILASYLELNVSATHSIIGAIIGFGLVHAGSDGVIWAKRDPGAFPPYKGVVAIILSWFISPIFTGCAAAIIFFTVRTLVLRRKNAYVLSFWCLPPFVCITVFINAYFILTKGARKLLTSNNDDWSDSKAAWIAAVCAAVGTVLSAAIAVPLLKRFVDKQYKMNSAAIQIHQSRNGQKVAVDAENPDKVVEPVNENNFKLANDSPQTPVSSEEPQRGGIAGWTGKMKKAALHGLTYDIHAVVDEDEHLNQIHTSAEVFEPRIELSFAYLQVFSACCVIFAHGAGEVGYMAGPLSTIWAVYQKGFITTNVSQPIWCILIGAIALVIGLATYGYKVTRAMGVRLCKISPTRGFAAELATALVITVAAQYGLPTSSSQCLVGAIVGVGLLEGAKGVNWKQFTRQFVAWVLTVAVVGLLTAALFAQGVYAPSEIDNSQVIEYENRIANMTQGIYRGFNTSLASYRQASNESALPRLPYADWLVLNRTIANLTGNVKTIVDPKKVQTVDPVLLTSYFNQALDLIQRYTVNALGQNDVFPGADVCSSNLTSALQSNQPAVCVAPSLVVRQYATPFP